MCNHAVHTKACRCSAAVEDLYARLKGMRAVDLAPRLERGIPRWPTHPHFFVDQTITYEHDGYYCQSVVMPEHVGCHVDAPSHVAQNRKDDTIDTLPVDALVAPATVYDFSDRDWKPGEVLTADDIEAYERKHGCTVGTDDIALVNFGWLKAHWRRDNMAQWYATNSPGMNEDVTILFKERGVRAVGADTIACEGALVDGRIIDMPGHGKHWLPNGILILESVANLELLSKRCLFVATALPIERGSGSPLRPIAYCPNEE